jgi:hypothetical protein
MTRPHALVLAGVVALLLTGTGCQERGPTRVRVTGSVTYEGKPVPYGNITFEPDTDKGNHGPQGFAKIQDGKYDSDIAGTGPSPGPQTVVIEGYPELGRERPGQGRLIFNFRTTWDLPVEDTSRDFEIPATAGRRESAPASNLPPP